jgi:HSP20 family protein
MTDDRAFFEGLANNNSPVPEEGPEAEFTKAAPAALRNQSMSTEEIGGEDEGQLTIDVYQNAAEVVIESPIAGVEEKDLDIDITSDTVTIRGMRQRERRVRAEDYIYQECYWGRFSRSVVLPTEVDADKSEATIKNGVLTIRLPKLNRLRAKKLSVRKSE